MLEELTIRGLGVIDDAALDFDAGLTAVTGETGAGKTMVVTGLGLLFGGRGDSGLVRTGAARAVVEGRLMLPPANPALARIAELDGEIDAGPDPGAPSGLVISRSVGSDGRSRAHAGGRAVPIGVLGELAADVLAVHGQGDQHRLLGSGQQRAALDRYAGPPAAAARDAYAAVHARYREAARLLAELTAQAAQRARELDALRFGLSEIEAVAPQPGEDVALAAETERLGHADGLRAAAAAAHAVLAGDDATAADTGAADVDSLMAQARHALEPVRGHDAAIADLAGRLAEVSYLASDLAADVASYLAGIEADPVRLAVAQERRAALGKLVRKYADGEAACVDGVLAWASSAAARAAELDGDDARIAALQLEVAALEGTRATLAGELTAIRTAAAESFGDAVTNELHDLAMPNAQLTARVSAAGFGPDGADDVEFLLMPHAGADPRPLAKGASGGELSRVMLAIEVVLTGGDPPPTLVFDEVDAGVGGRAAVEIGRRLARLGRMTQVIVVTHLPQVAAFATRHLAVEKSASGDGAITRSGVRGLDDEGRTAELSRMLAGLEGSDLALGHAAELLDTARAFTTGLA